MKRILTLLTFALFICMGASAQMSDDDVIKYVQKEHSAGKSQQSIALELQKKGVTKSQMLRLKEKYEKMQKNGEIDDSVESDSSAKERSRKGNGETLEEASGEGESASDKKWIFGHDVFRSKELSFEPNMNIATPTNYVLGPGDEVILDISGASQKSGKYKISPEGSVIIDKIGPVHISGMTVAQAQSAVIAKMGSHYQNSSIKLTVGQTRTITVNVLGEVETPGTYTLSAFSTVFNALYLAGGITNIGTMRNIKVTRGGRTISIVDVYDYILNGKLTGNVMLHDNDAIIVGAYDAIVSINGAIKRPMLYEMKSGESLKSLLAYAGDFTGDANTATVKVERSSAEGLTVHTVGEMDFTFGMQDGDAVTIFPSAKRYRNMVEVYGAIFYPGRYSLTDDCNSVRTLIAKAGGVLENVFDNRAVLYRMQENRTFQVIAVDLKNILAGNAPDIILENEDRLIVTEDLQLRPKKVYIYGPVNREGEIDYADNMTIEDAIILANGLKEEAMLSDIEVSRRIQYTDESDPTYNKKAQIYTFTLKEGLLLDDAKAFILKPNDVITIKRKPEYSDVELVYVGGEVNYPGTYSLTSGNDRLSDLIKRAGGIKQNGYTQGAKLTRYMNQDEKERAEQLWEMEHQNDTIDTDMKIKERYPVGINLTKALAKPGTIDDVVMRSGDNLIIPKFDNTVKINGEVLYPNTVSYLKGKSASYYIKQAGGVTNEGRKRKAYIIYANGQVGSARGKVLPGSEIVVPEKDKKDNSGQKTSIFLGSASTITAIAAILITALK